ncbi:MAG: DNA polymerase IV [Candidatus Levybacteria bacterium]|nr:DNA polymerase IV [Candidatus Levybacteria bacterium]
MKQLNNRTILHIDFDSFFASVEQQHNPLFRGKPLGVTATNGRNCIIASSREAKALGIGTATRVYDAKRICPTIFLTGADFRQYWEESQKFIKICKDYSPFVEVFSIDELFMDVTKTIHLYGSVERLMQHIKQRIACEIGPFITVSIGVSYNKMLAKMGSGLQKPNGITYITPENLLSVYKKSSLLSICGIGSRIKLRLESMGIYTLLQLREAPVTALIAEFGNVEGIFLKNVGQGIDMSDVIPYTEKPSVKSVGREYCLPQNQYDKHIVLQNMYELCEEIGIKLRRLSKKARSAGVSIRGTHIIKGHKTHKTYFSTGKEMFAICSAILMEHKEEFYSGYTRQIGVWAGYLEDEHNTPLSLFDTQKSENLLKTIDVLNEKFGDHTIRNGFLLYADKLTTVPNGWMADKYERTLLSSAF